MIVRCFVESTLVIGLLLIPVSMKLIILLPHGLPPPPQPLPTGLIPFQTLVPILVLIQKTSSCHCKQEAMAGHYISNFFWEE